MVQTTSFRHPEQTNSSSPDQAGIVSTATVTCSICEAGYVPSLARPDLWQATPDVVEAAFMSICHFCFRCRRPACPECWDFVHRVCGACVQDAHLPFRTEAPPLQGIKFPPIRRERPIQEERVPSVFVCGDGSALRRRRDIYGGVVAWGGGVMRLGWH